MLLIGTPHRRSQQLFITVSRQTVNHGSFGNDFYRVTKNINIFLKRQCPEKSRFIIVEQIGVFQDVKQLEFDAVNDNLPEIVELYGTNSRKITCDFYIDDKAVLPAMVNS